jgi:predicted MFS family arabinose efflux permease
MSDMTASTIQIPARGVPIGLLAAGGFVAGCGMRLLDPLLPLVASSLHVTVSGASGLIACFLLPYGLGQIAFGPLGDKLGKLRVAAVAVVLYGACVLACAAAPGLTALLWIRAASGLFAGAVNPLAMAWLGDAVPYERRQETLGKFLTGMVMAQMLTGPISGIIGEHGGWRVSFLAFGAAAVAVGVTLLAWLGRAAWHTPADALPAAVPGLVAYVRLFRRRSGRWLLIAAFFDGLCLFGGAFPYVGAYLIQDFGLGAARAGLIVAGFGVGSFLYTRFARRLVARFGEGGLLLIGGGGIALGLAALSLARSWPEAALAQSFIGLVFYMFHGVLQARATEEMPEARATAVCGFALALFVGQGFGALAFGALLGSVGYRGGFATAAAAMVLLTIWTRRGLIPRPPLGLPSTPVSGSMPAGGTSP